MKNKVTLYIATHNKTGLNYFGKTTIYFTQEELQKYYHGSGKEWNQHLKEFGDDVTMEIYGIYNLDDIENKALTFSLINDIVESDLWANMILENGLGGGSVVGRKHSKESIEKMRLAKTGKKYSDEAKKNMSLAQTGKIVSEETREKMSKAQKGRVFSDEWKNRISESKKGVEPKQITCPHCSHTGDISNTKRFHFNNCIDRTDITQEEREILMNSRKKGNYKKMVCPHCSMVGAGGSMKRYHFDNCKYKKEKLFQ
jgi:hypothetical protein